MSRAGSFTRGVNYRKLSEKYISLLLLLFLTPLVFVILGIVVSSSKNHRPELIQAYNERTEMWFNKYFEFLKYPFQLNDTSFSNIEYTSGSYFPVSDSCNETEDPHFGCIYTSTLFLESTTQASELIRFSVKNGNSTVIINESIPKVQITILNKQNLRCATSHECNDLCLEKGGIWDMETYQCNITRFLESICYRLQSISNTYQLDNSTLVTTQNHGCYYSNNWSPYHYSIEESSSISVRLRLNYDPVITASLYTQGCSDLYLSNSTSAFCFGRTYEDQKIMAHLLFFTGLLLFFTEVISVFAVCFFWVGKKRHVSPTRVLSPSYEQIFTPLMYAETHPLDLPDELAGLGTKGLQDRLAVNGTLRVPKPNFSDSSPGPVEILEV